MKTTISIEAIANGVTVSITAAVSTEKLGNKEAVLNVQKVFSEHGIKKTICPDRKGFNLIGEIVFFENFDKAAEFITKTKLVK